MLYKLTDPFVKNTFKIPKISIFSIKLEEESELDEL